MCTGCHGNHKPHLLQLTQPQRMARLVFAISLDDAQKVINVRSPLVLNNVTELPLEVRLTAPTVADGNRKSTARKGTESECIGKSLPVHK